MCFRIKTLKFAVFEITKGITEGYILRPPFSMVLDEAIKESKEESNTVRDCILQDGENYEMGSMLCSRYDANRKR